MYLVETGSEAAAIWAITAANHSQRRMALLAAERVCSNQGGKKAARPFDGDSYFSASNGWVIFATGKMRHTLLWNNRGTRSVVGNYLTRIGFS